MTNRILVTMLAWGLTNALAVAEVISYTDTLGDPNAIHLNTFTVLGSADVVIQTYGFGGTGSAPGGTNFAGIVIPAGGFDPVVAVFASDGTFVDQNDDGFCPSGALDGGNCFDSTLQLFALPAGVYTFSLTVAGNYAAGANISDGFTGGGDFLGRTSSFAADVGVSEISQVPEPGSFLMFGTAIGLLHLLRARPWQR